MHESVISFLLPASMMFLAEMGDKTQLLALAFASRYKPAKVLFSMFLSILLLNGLAVGFGSVVSRYVGLNLLVQSAAAFAFLLFGLLALKPERPAKKESKSFRGPKAGVILTVSLTFFLAELGDKTQLTAISLAVKYPETPAMVFIGTSVGMFLADSLGVIIGAVMLKKIPERLIKTVAAAFFLLFGLYSSWEVLTKLLWLPLPTSLITEAVILLVVGILAFLSVRRK